MLTDVIFHIPNHVRSALAIYNPSACNDTHCRRSSIVSWCQSSRLDFNAGQSVWARKEQATGEDDRHLVVTGLVAFSDIEEAWPLLWNDSYLRVDW